MIKAVLSWLHLRQDALTKAKAALADDSQIMAAQRVTIEALRELNEHLIFINNELLAADREALLSVSEAGDSNG